MQLLWHYVFENKILSPILEEEEYLIINVYTNIMTTQISQPNMNRAVHYKLVKMKNHIQVK